MNEFEEMLTQSAKRIAKALENLNDKLVILDASNIGKILVGEKSVGLSSPKDAETIQITDSRPLPIRSYNGNPEVDKALGLTKLVETQNFIDVRECIDYSEKSWKLISYDMQETYVAKQHVSTVVREKGLTQVIFKPESTWAINKLEWK